MNKKYDMALIMNALALPGSGYFFIGEKIRGILISALSITLFTLPSVQYTLAVIKRLSLMIPEQPRLNATGMALYEAWQINKESIIICFSALFILWIYCLIDVLMRRKKFNSIIIGG